jgi:two-component system, OmpR family, phosphate regulon sensor histidine kinase PhoR
LKKLFIIFIFLILLPVLIYTGYKITTLNEAEEMLEESYLRQLDAILFSVNQYCWDVVNNWTSDINSYYANRENSSHLPDLTIFSGIKEVLTTLLLLDSLGQTLEFISPELNLQQQQQIKQEIYRSLSSNPAVISRLLRFEKSGYRKIEPVVLSNPEPAGNQRLFLLFSQAVSTNSKNQYIFGMQINIEKFITQVSLPKISEIAQDRFDLTVYYQGKIIPAQLTTAENSNPPAVKKAVWLLPKVELGISLQGQSLEDLVRNRSRNDLFLIGLVNAILIIAGWLLYRNIRREMELAEMKSTFVSNVSHELRTPLSLIRMFAETLELERVQSETKKKEYYKIIGRETERLTHLINNILTFSKMEAGRKEYHFQKLNLNQIARKVLESYEFHLQEKGFRVSSRLDPDLPDIFGDEDALSEAVINLVDNAIKYSKDKKFLEIKTCCQEQLILLEVSDQGIGIAQSEHLRIFEKFYRVSSGLVRETKGTGLGLALVKNIIEAHQGHITLQSKPGEGSTFILQFPRK